MDEKEQLYRDTLEAQQLEIQRLQGERDNYRNALTIRQQKGKRSEIKKKAPFFTMAFVETLRGLQLTEAQKSLLMHLAPRIHKITGLITERFPMNQTAIAAKAKLSVRYCRAVLKSLVDTGLLIEQVQGKETYYRLDGRHFSKAGRSKGRSFVKFQVRSLKELAGQLPTDSMALLFTVSLYLEYQTNWVFIDGTAANQTGLLKLMGWVKEDRLHAAMEPLLANGVMYKIKRGRGYVYLVDGRFVFNGTDIDTWLNSPQNKRIVRQ